MIEQFNFDIRLIFAILNGKVSAAINRKLYRNFRQNGLEISPEQWTVLIFLWEKDGVTQQELCNATFKDKPSMTRLIDNMERQHLVVRISDKKDRRTNLIHLTKDGKELEEKARVIAGQTLKEALHGNHINRVISQRNAAVVIAAHPYIFITETLQTSACGLSVPGNSVQPVCEEPGHDECHPA